MESAVKIGIIGCSGLGKSSIASAVSKKLEIPFLNSKDITRPILRKFDYRYSEGHFVESFLSRKDIEFELVDKRIEEENLLSGGFVTDRTTLECFCYSFLSLDSYSEDEFSMLEMICKSNMTRYTHLFKLPINAGWLEENGIRTMNVHFQRQIDIMIKGVIQEWKTPVVEIPFEIAKGNHAADFIVESI